MKLSVVTWIDACGAGEAGWRPVLRIKKLTPAKCISVGFVLKDTDEFILLCPHLAPLDGSGDGDGEIAIPKAWILERKDIDWR